MGFIYLLTPPFSFRGFEIQQVYCGETTLTNTVRAISPTAACPSCQQVSHCLDSGDPLLCTALFYLKMSGFSQLTVYRQKIWQNQLLTKAFLDRQKQRLVVLVQSDILINCSLWDSVDKRVYFYAICSTNID